MTYYKDSEKITTGGGKLPIFSVTQRCLLKPYGDEEMKCLACGYITFRNDTKTTQQIIQQMIKDGYDIPDCSNGG